MAAAVKGFTGVTDIRFCKLVIWHMLLSTDSLLTKRDEIMTAMKKWAREEGVQIEEDFMLEKQWFTDLLAGDFTRGEPCATEHNISLIPSINGAWCQTLKAEYSHCSLRVHCKHLCHTSQEG